MFVVELSLNSKMSAVRGYKQGDDMANNVESIHDQVEFKYFNDILFDNLVQVLNGPIY